MVDGHQKLIILTVFVAFCSANWQDGNDGVDRLNGDLLNMPISLKAGTTPRDCAQLCYANTQCKAWAFNKPNCNGLVAAQCYLKAEVTQQSTNPCKVMTCITTHHLSVSCATITSLVTIIIIIMLELESTRAPAWLCRSLPTADLLVK